MAKTTKEVHSILHIELNEAEVRILKELIREGHSSLVEPENLEEPSDINSLTDQLLTDFQKFLA